VKIIWDGRFFAIIIERNYFSVRGRSDKKGNPTGFFILERPSYAKREELCPERGMFFGGGNLSKSLLFPLIFA